MFIRSERLFLRPGWPEDWAELHALIDDEAVARNLSRAPWPYSPDEARAFASLPQARRHPHFFVTLPGASGARLLGCAGLADVDGETELGFWIAQRHWGQGFATEAARAVISLARTLGHRRVVASHFADHAAGGRVLVKAGFRPTGQVRARYCAARRASAPSLVHALELPGAGNCDAGAATGIKPMRAA